MAGDWRDEKPTRRAISPRAQRLADELQARAMELRDNSIDGLSIREAVALAAVQLGLAPDAAHEARDDARFWEHVKKIRGGCWEWQGPRSPFGYGQFSIEGRNIAAHRYAYEERVGSIPPRLVLDHLCRNPPCVKPDHLEAVTIIQNTLRGRSPWALAVRGEGEPKEWRQRSGSGKRDAKAPGSRPGAPGSSKATPTGGERRRTARKGAQDARERRELEDRLWTAEAALNRLVDVLSGNAPSTAGTCDASTAGIDGALLGPCVLRHGHDGPVHKDAEGARWADQGAA